MKWDKKLVAVVVAIIFGLSFVLVPLASQVSPAQAAVTWVKSSTPVTLGSQKYVADAWVITDGTTYEMWYTHGKKDLSLTEIIDVVRTLNLGNLIDDVVNLDRTQFLNHLSDLVGDVDAILGILDGTSAVIGYATSPDGRAWAIETSEVVGLAGGSAAWDSVGAPCVVKNSVTDYEMWYTRIETDLTPTDLEDTLTDMGGTTAVRKAASLYLLNSTSTVIGYATSADGETWAVQDSEVLPLSSNNVWDSVGTPCVVKNDATDYEMWYTRPEADLTQADLDTVLADIANFGIADLLDLLDGTSTVIGYATSTDGEVWAVQDSQVLPVGSTIGAWDSVADPSVIKTGATTYEMWYTNGNTDLAPADLPTLLDEIIELGPIALWNTLRDEGLTEFLLDLVALDIDDIKSILDDTSTVIGYATSSDGETWTVQSSQHLVGSSDSPWSSVAAPSVTKTGSKYEMWYTEGIDDLSLQDLWDLALGGDLPIGYAYYIPAAPGPGPAPSAPETAEEIEEMDPDDAADALEEMDADDAADIMEEIDPDNAADIFEEMDSGNAADIVEEMDPDDAAGIVEEMDPGDAADIFEEMDIDDAADVMEELTLDTLTDVIGEMTEDALTDILPGLSPDTLYSVDPEVLFDSLPNVPTEQLLSEEPPQPPAEATAPVVVYTTPSGARYLAVRTWAGEWVVVMATPMPVDQLMIKTKQALTDVETTVDIFDQRPSEAAVSLPADQVVYTYLSITFDNATPEDIELGHITFQVENEWLEQNSIHKWSVALNRYDPELGQWITLPTKRVREDSSYIYYTSTITHFSTFAISGSQVLPSLNFEVADLTISPVEAETGQAITISADITNISSEAATYVATLWIDNTVEAGQDIYLEAGETEPTSFTVTRDAEGSYDVRIDRLFGSFSVTAEVEVVELPANFVASNLSVTPTEVDIGQQVTISVVITNIGDLTGSYEVALKIDDVVVATEDVTLAGGASQTVVFSTAREVAGTYTVTIDSLSETFEVKALPPPVKPINWWLIGGIIAGVIIIGLVIWQVITRRRV